MVCTGFSDVDNLATVSALRQALAVVEGANNAKSRVLAAASHDLRQPLQSMFLFIETVKRSAQDERSMKAMEMMATSMNTLRDLLDSMLDLSRLDAGKIEAKMEDINIAEIIDIMNASYAPLAAKKGLTWRSPSACKTLKVRSDRILLGRILRNLAENAIRYTDSGAAWIECHGERGMLRVEVHDTGCGIPAEHRESIFAEFHQVGGPTGDRGGLGLGLAIVQRLATILDHPLGVRSTLGEGSVFSLTLPLSITMGLPSPEHGDVANDAEAATTPLGSAVDDPTVLRRAPRLRRDGGSSGADP